MRASQARGADDPIHQFLKERARTTIYSIRIIRNSNKPVEFACLEYDRCCSLELTHRRRENGHFACAYSRTGAQVHATIVWTTLESCLPADTGCGLPAGRRRSLPKVDRLRASAGIDAQIPWDFQPSGGLSLAIPCEESRRVLPGSLVRGQLQIRGVKYQCESVVKATQRVPSGCQLVMSVPDRDAACLCRKTQAVCDAEVYRKSTANRGSG